MFKGISKKWMWAAGALVFMCLGLGSYLSSTFGVVLIFVGFVLFFLWTRKYITAKKGVLPPGVQPVAPVVADSVASKVPLDKQDKG
jgi:hypothetical protein